MHCSATRWTSGPVRHGRTGTRCPEAKAVLFPEHPGLPVHLKLVSVGVLVISTQRVQVPNISACWLLFPKTIPLLVVGDQKPQILGIWTLWARPATKGSCHEGLLNGAYDTAGQGSRPRVDLHYVAVSTNWGFIFCGCVYNKSCTVWGLCEGALETPTSTYTRARICVWTLRCNIARPNSCQAVKACRPTTHSKAQDGPTPLQNMVFGPKTLKI